MTGSVTICLETRGPCQGAPELEMRRAQSTATNTIPVFRVDCPGHPRLCVPLGRLTCDRVCTTGNRVHAWPQRRPTLGPTTCLSLCSLRASYTHGDGRQTLRRRQPLWSRRCSEVQAEAVKSRRDHTADEWMTIMPVTPVSG